METRVNEWDLVIKVKYGDSLRRIGAHVHGQSMDHDMSKLRAKITNLFKLSPDADIFLTYTDEDGDAVTLDDDGDLHDAVISQQLNPLRISVQLKSNTYGSSDPKSQISDPTVLPRIETTSLQISSAVDEVLKSVPEPFRNALSEISHGLALKTASAAPAFAELVDYFSKLGLSNVSPPSHGPTGQSLGTSSGASTNPLNPSVSDVRKVSTDLARATTVLRNTNSGNPEGIPWQNESAKMTQERGDMPTSVDLNLDPPTNLHASEFPSVNDLLSCTWATSYSMDLEKEGCDIGVGKSDTVLENLSVPPVDHIVEHNSRNSATPKPYVPPCYTYGVWGDNNRNQIPTTATPTSGVVYNPQFDHNRHVGVPTPDVPLPCLSFPMHPYRRTHSYHESMLHTFHRGVQCDGCGMHPIMGPRFKSNVKEDYDLCSFCFSEIGNGADYTRIERASYRSPRLFKELYNPHSRYRLPPSHGFHGCGVRQSRVKLESRFIQDVTVVDGTVMPPCTPFTKIWRMRNNGTVAWPFGTQLVWIGGDQFGNRASAELEIPANGCPVDEEIDIAVDFTAPSRPGRYISYWRMASPSGQKFGQRVWVIIQVENHQPKSAAGSFHAELNLNLPPESSDRSGLGMIEMNTESLSGACPESNVTNASTTELIEPLITASTSAEPVVVDDDLLGCNDGVEPMSNNMVPYPIIDFPASSSNESPPLESDGNTVEQSLLKELEEMGFKQIELNKEVLRLNEYDLEQSVDDLCGFAEWDPLLVELNEMGFCNKELNKKLLVKNGGSIKRVVLDLIAGEKDE